MNEGRYPEVVVHDAVKQLDYVETIASHGNVKQPRKIHPQPHNIVTMPYVCMRVAGWTDLDYDTVLTVSGVGLLFAYRPKDFRIKYDDLRIRLMDERVGNATGFGWEWVPFDNEEKVWELVKTTIDSARLVQINDMAESLFAGYQDAENKEDRRVFVIGEPFPGKEWWTWQQFSDWVGNTARKRIGRHTQRGPSASPREVALRVLRDASAWASKPPELLLKQLPNTVFGFDGMRTYADDIEDVDGKPEDYFESPWRGCHAINPQWSARKSTAFYLQHVADASLFPTSVNKNIADAAALYLKAWEAWLIFNENLGTLAQKGAWQSKESRRAGSSAIRKAVAHEEAAIAKIKAALEQIPTDESPNK